MSTTDLFAPVGFLPDGENENAAGGLSESDLAIIDEVLEDEGQERGSLVAVLARLQERLGGISSQVQEVVARRLAVPSVTVQELVSFDPDLVSLRRAAGVTRFCGGAACLAPRGLEMLQAVGAPGTAARAGAVTAPCLGACWAAPVAETGARRFERLTPVAAGGLRAETGPETGRPHRPPLRGAPAAAWHREELAQIRARLGERMRLRASSAPDQVVREVLVCNGSACSREAADRVAEVVSRSLAERGLDRSMRVVRVGCRGEDVGAVTITACPPGWRVRDVDEGGAGALVAALERDPASVPSEPIWAPSGAASSPGVLRRCGLVDPCSLEEYIASGGFSALERALALPDGRVWAMRALEASGLRARGEDDGLLARRLSDAAAEKVAIVLCPCLSTDGHLAADSLVLGGDPFAVVEGVMLAGFLSGASSGMLMPPAGAIQLQEQFELAVALARRRGLVGPSVLGTPFGFDFRVTPAPRQLVAIDQSALRRFVLAGGALKPVPRALAGGVPPSTIIDPESAARLCGVLEMAVLDADGLEPLAEKRLVTVAGSAVSPAVLEVPAAASLEAVLALTSTRAGTESSPRVKGVLSGGLIGVCEAGGAPAPGVAARGSLLVLDDSTCVVGLLSGILTMLAREACGACAPGRTGVRALRDLWLQVTEGRGGDLTLAAILEIAAHLDATARCALGRGAARVVTSALAAFGEEVAAHLDQGRCPAGQCAALRAGG